MTNDELKKKIMEVIDNSVDDWATRDKRGRIRVHIEKIADALIAAGIGDVKEVERALYIAAREIQYLSGNFGAIGEFLAKEKGVPYFMEQAEKELAEEGKDEP